MSEAEKEKQSFDFEAHRRTAIDEYRKQRNSYEQFAEEVRNILIEAINGRGIRISDIQFRAKTLDSFGKKAITPSETAPGEPKYANALADIKDLAGVRVISFFPRTVDEVCQCISEELEVIERVDHTASALQEERLGYQSVHLLAKLKNNRTALSEYRRFRGLVAEIQVRTILQHAWAEIEHDIRYKSTASIPKVISRRFMALAGMLEMADREFQAIQEEDKAIRANVETLIAEKRLDEVELTPDALRAYLDHRLGSDDRISDWSYEYTTKVLRRMGYRNLFQVDECISGRDDDLLSRLALGGRQGQLTRFEVLMIAGMGPEKFYRNHPSQSDDWYNGWVAGCAERLTKGGVTLGSYSPPQPDA